MVPWLAGRENDATDDAHHGGDERRSSRVGVLGPPQRQAVEAAADDLAERLELAVGEIRRELAQQSHVGRPLPALQLRAQRLDVGVSRRVPEHARGERVRLDVDEPGVNHRREPDSWVPLDGHLGQGGRRQLVAVALEQAQVQVLFRLEESIERGFADAGPFDDVVDGRGLEAVGSEETGGCALDPGPDLGSGRRVGLSTRCRTY